jgi:hypothetical protein
MTIEIPDKWLGEPIEGSMEKVLAEKEQPRPEKISQTNAPSLDGFEYVSSIGLYVAKQRELHNKNWNEATQELHARGDRMPTPYEFVEFIKYLRSQSTDEAYQVLDEIYKVGGNWRSEWLDAQFSTGNSGTIMRYHIFGNGIETKHADLVNVLAETKTPGINLDAWLNDNEFGLPKSDVPNGDLYYYKPANGRVAWFSAYSGRAGLYCNRDPSDSSDSLGVRAVRRPRENLTV